MGDEHSRAPAQLITTRLYSPTAMLDQLTPFCPGSLVIAIGNGGVEGAEGRRGLDEEVEERGQDEQGTSQMPQISAGGYVTLFGPRKHATHIVR